MRKQLLVLTMLFIGAVNYGQTTVTIPDDAFEAYLETIFVSNIDSDGSTTDGSITFTDINLVTTIDLPTASVTTVTDLTGVNQFPKLKNLYCNDNNITGTLDLSGLASLTNFSCFNNASLTDIDFTGCKNIYNLKANDCALTSVDISVTTLNAAANPARLRYVALHNNSITSLDISGNTGFYKLDLYSNSDLTSIDISSLTLLTTLRFQNCNVAGDLDVSSNSLLETLGTYNNDNLTSINLGAIPYTNFAYFKTSLSDNLTCILTDNPSDFEIGGPLDTAIAGSYAVDVETNFVVNEGACIALSTDDLGKIVFDLYPNITKNEFTINSSEKASYELINLNGQIVMKGNLELGKNNIYVSDIISGVYLVRVTSSNGGSSVEKLILR